MSPHATVVLLVLCLALAVPDAGAVVLSGRLVSTSSAFYEAEFPVSVSLRIPTEVISRGVCVDMIPLHTQFGATTQTICTSTSVEVTFKDLLPAVYTVSARTGSATVNSRIDPVWQQRAVVIIVFTANASMADTITGVILCTIVVIGLMVFVMIPLLFRLKYAEKPTVAPRHYTVLVYDEFDDESVNVFIVMGVCLFSAVVLTIVLWVNNH